MCNRYALKRKKLIFHNVKIGQYPFKPCHNKAVLFMCASLNNGIYLNKFIISTRKCMNYKELINKWKNVHFKIDTARHKYPTCSPPLLRNKLAYDFNVRKINFFEY